LELAVEAADATSAYLSSDGGAAEHERLLSAQSWRRQDGRASLAFVALLDGVRRARRSGASIDVAMVDAEPPGDPNDPDWQVEREQQMAANVLDPGRRRVPRGHRATTHWAYTDVLANLGVDVVRARWVEDDRYLTTAGVSAGIDGGIHLVQRLLGDDIAKLTQLGMQYEPEPPLGPIDWDPTAIEAVRGIWRPPLDEILSKHPHLAASPRE
jgi:hypothetical protein